MVRLASLLILFCMLFSFQTFAAENESQQGIMIKNPGTDLWRDVRQRDSIIQGTTQIRSGEANVFMNISGEAWRQYRMLELIPRAGIAIVVALIIILLFRLLRGKIKLSAGRSGKLIKRFTPSQRTAHWITAILFVILGITGLLLLFGRTVLIPVIGNEAFGHIAIVAKTLHDYLGPLFMFSLIVLFILFVKENIPSPKIDFQWLMKGGGLFGGHASSDRYNAGEKGWFWIAALVGITVVVSGMVLDFPIFGQTRETLEFYHVIHSISAIVLIVASFGHIYMGTAAMEGTFEVMKTGYCDSNWAKEHHDLWYEKVKHTEQDSSKS